MVRLTYPRPLDRLLILGTLGGAAAILLFSEWQGGLYVENGPVEILQLAILVLAALLFVRASRHLIGWAALSTLGLATLSLLALARETPRCSSPFYEFGPCLSGSYKDVVYWLAAAFPVAVVLCNRDLRLRLWNRDALSSLLRFVPSLLPLLALMPLVVGSQLAEHFRLPAIEELLETGSYLLLLLFGLHAAQAGDRTRQAASRTAERNLPKGAIER